MLTHVTWSVVRVLSECRTLCHHTCDTNKTSSLYVSFSVGAVAVTVLSVVLSQVSTLTVDSSLGYLPTHADKLTLRHRRALLNDTVLDGIIRNDTVLDPNDTELIELSNSHFLNVSYNVTASTAAVTTLSARTTFTTTPRARKPLYLDGSRLGKERGAADGSKVRNKIRQNLGQVPAEQQAEDEKIDSVPSASATPLNSSSLASLLQNVMLTNTTNNSLTLSQAKTDNGTVSARKMSTLQDIMTELESLVTKDKHSNNRSNDSAAYTTTVTAAAAGSTSTSTSSVHLPSPTSTLQSTRKSTSAGVSHTIVGSSLKSSRLSSVGSSVTSPLVSVLATLRDTATTPRVTDAAVGNVSFPKSTLGNASLAKVSASPLRTTTVGLSANLSQHAVSTPSPSHPAKSTYSGCHVILLTMAVITLTVAVVFAGIWSPPSSCCRSRPVVTKSHHLPTTNSHTRCLVAVHITSMLLHFSQSAVEWTYSGLVVEFAGSVLAWRRTWSLMLLFVFWASFAVGRFVCSIVVARVRPWILMFSGVLLGSVTSLVMLAGSLQYSTGAEMTARNALVWFSSAVLGVASSVVLPTANKYIPSTASLSAAAAVGAGLGRGGIPYISASLSDVYSTGYIIDAVCVAAFGAVAATVLLKYVVTRSTGSTGPVSSRHFHLVDSSSVEDLANVMTDTVDEEAQLLNQAGSADIETSLIINTPSSSSSSSSQLQSFIRNISSASKND